MFRRSSNNPFIPAGGMNSGSMDTLGGPETVGSRYGGLLGQTVVHSMASALKASKTATGTLYMGVYQLVKFTTAIVRGELLFWDTLANNGLNDFEVTHTVTAVNPFRAGVALYTDASAAGKFGYIQVAGLASCLYGTVTSAVLGNIVIQTSLTTTTVDAIADAGTTFATNGGAKLFVGTAYETPVSDTVKRVLLNLAGFYPNIG
jgi:hypothetical protein